MKGKIPKISSSNSVFFCKMKNKRSGETNDEVRGQRNLRLNGPDSKKNTKVRKNLQRLGGRGLSLEAFANAKSRSSNYNPALISMFFLFILIDSCLLRLSILFLFDLKVFLVKNKFTMLYFHVIRVFP